MRTMKAASPALRCDSLASAVIMVKAGNIPHESFKGLQFSGSKMVHDNSPFLVVICRKSANVNYFQLLGNKKEGSVSYSMMETKRTPLNLPIDD